MKSILRIVILRNFVKVIESSFRRENVRLLLRSSVTVICLLSICSSESFAEMRPLNKLKRGIINIVTAPLEVPKNVYIVNKNLYKSIWKFQPRIFANFLGLGRGSGQAMIREVSGVWDVISFPLAFPKDYDPIYKPDYLWEEFKKEEK